MKKRVIGVVAIAVLAAAGAAGIRRAEAASTYCLYDCGETVQYWCGGGGLWQVTGGDQWLQLEQYHKGCA